MVTSLLKLKYLVLIETGLSKLIEQTDYPIYDSFQKLIFGERSIKSIQKFAHYPEFDGWHRPVLYWRIAGALSPHLFHDGPLQLWTGFLSRFLCIGFPFCTK